MLDDKHVRVALAGVGNCASALVQGLHFYRVTPQALTTTTVRRRVAGFDITDIDIVAAFDVDPDKVGLDLSDAIFAKSNCATRIHRPPASMVKVARGPLLDGLTPRIRERLGTNVDAQYDDVRSVLVDSGADVLVILLPSGAEEATRYYVECALATRVAVVNAIPVNVANNPEITSRASADNIPIIGDDIKSQIGATIVHKVLAELFPLRAAMLCRTVQLDWGGDSDFENLVSEGRYDCGKRDSKTKSVVWSQPNRADIEVRVSAVDHIPFLANQKEACIRLEGLIFGNQPVNITVGMQVQDAYNSAGVLVDAVRVATWARRHNEGGVIKLASAAFCKSPPEQMLEEVAHQSLDAYLLSHGSTASPTSVST